MGGRKTGFFLWFGKLHAIGMHDQGRVSNIRVCHGCTPNDSLLHASELTIPLPDVHDVYKFLPILDEQYPGLRLSDLNGNAGRPALSFLDLTNLNFDGMQLDGASILPI